jgi:hypothetical protein
MGRSFAGWKGEPRFAVSGGDGEPRSEVSGGDGVAGGASLAGPGLKRSLVKALSRNW